MSKLSVNRDSCNMVPRSSRKTVLYGVLFVLGLLLIYHLHTPCEESQNRGIMVGKQNFMVGADKKTYTYDRSMPLVFIGGVPRSGTTLVRVMLDAHPDIRCGEETRVVPRLLQMRAHWIKSQKESMRLQEAGLTNEVLDSAMAAFILEIIARHGEPAPRLCNKDPFTLKSAVYLSQLFPNSKFIFMVRDGRATVHSIITRKVSITGFDLSSYRQCLTKWNAAVQAMSLQCKEVRPSRCLPVYYEQLVLHPREWMQKILLFLEIPWNETVLHHEEMINKPGGASLSKVERSSDQVIKPVNLEALSKWVGQIPDDVIQDMPQIAPMLSTLGYDPYANPPNYGKPDSYVSDNTYEIKRHEQFWQSKADNLLKLSRKGLKPKEDENNADFDAEH